MRLAELAPLRALDYKGRTSPMGRCLPCWWLPSCWWLPCVVPCVVSHARACAVSRPLASACLQMRSAAC